MKRALRLLSVLLALTAVLALAQCTSSSRGPSSNPDGGLHDAGLTDAGVVDAGPQLPAYMTVPSGMAGLTLAQVPGARELAALPNGDLLVGTDSKSIYIVPSAEAAGLAGAASVFITLTDTQAAGVTYGPDGFVYVSTEHAVWKIPYSSGDTSKLTSAAVKIAQVRTGGVAAGSDGDIHHTSSVAVTASSVFVSVGSSCNACKEDDPTRASIQRMDLDGKHMTTYATRIRNAIAITVNPATGTVWAGGAGQDSLDGLHPYEYMDPVTLHGETLPVDYGWPVCEEDHVVHGNESCANTVAPRVEFPPYATHIGAVFYPANVTGPYRFPSSYSGGLFVSSHGSWHSNPSTPPGVRFVPMSGDTPATPVDWSHPTAQWSQFIGGLGTTTTTKYNARPTGIAVGAQGSLFVADDQNGVVYRIRPTAP